MQQQSGSTHLRSVENVPEPCLRSAFKSPESQTSYMNASEPTSTGVRDLLGKDLTS